MKKTIAVILLSGMLFMLCACGGNKAFDAAKEAYDNVDIAYTIADEMGSDIYESWRLAIYESDEILEEGIEYLASELNVSEEDLIDGAVLTVLEITGQEWDSLTEEELKNYRSNIDAALEIMEDELFSFCVAAASNAYEANGKAEEAATALTAAKEIMKEMSEKYSDYEHYPNLKGYYTTTSSFFDFCQNPTGSFEQIKDTVNDYRNEARDYMSDLDYIFE